MKGSNFYIVIGRVSVTVTSVSARFERGGGEVCPRQYCNPVLLFSQSEDGVEIATSSMEHAKDAVATNLLNFVCKEHEISDMVLELLTAQQNYHESCAKQIKAVLPELKVIK